MRIAAEMGPSTLAPVLKYQLELLTNAVANIPLVFQFQKVLIKKYKTATP